MVFGSGALVSAGNTLAAGVTGLKATVVGYVVASPAVAVVGTAAVLTLGAGYVCDKVLEHNRLMDAQKHDHLMDLFNETKCADGLSKVKEGEDVLCIRESRLEEVKEYHKIAKTSCGDMPVIKFDVNNEGFSYLCGEQQAQSDVC